LALPACPSIARAVSLGIALVVEVHVRELSPFLAAGGSSNKVVTRAG
jgi:hypothetical protein